MPFFGSHLFFPFIEHLHITAQGQDGYHELGLVPPQTARPERLAKAERKFENLDPKSSGHQEMTVFVDGNQDSKCNQKVEGV